MDTPTLPFLHNFNGFCSDAPLNVPAKFEVQALPVSEIIVIGRELWTPNIGKRRP